MGEMISVEVRDIILGEVSGHPVGFMRIHGNIEHTSPRGLYAT